MGIVPSLERSAIIDAITFIVLGADSYLLYSSLGYSSSGILSVSTDPKIVAIQVTAFLIAVYVLEFLHDKVRGGGDDLGLH